MRERALLIAGAIALAICLVCPIVDLFERWDHAFQTGNDSEYPLMILALCVGIVLVLGRLIVAVSPNILVSTVRYALQSALDSFTCLIAPDALVVDTESPPLSLRI